VRSVPVRLPNLYSLSLSLVSYLFLISGASPRDFPAISRVDAVREGLDLESIRARVVMRLPTPCPSLTNSQKGE